ncbi:MAG: hypothetical protein QF464_07125 [Myxococcota bacterium]|nr:hypothetical protein [Myxococcota bacterium]
MTKALTVAITLFICSSGVANAKPVDHTHPTLVVEAIFQAARTGDARYLPGLCDPRGENDGDTRDVCRARPGAKGWKEFRTYFAKGKISGNIQIMDGKAKVPFLFGPNGKRAETMNLIERNGKWYLHKF